MSDSSDIIKNLHKLANGKNQEPVKTIDKPPITSGENCKNVAELREHLLEHAGEVLDQYLNVATGRGEIVSTNHGIRSEVWDLIKEMLTNSGERILIPDYDGTPESILEAAARGQCSIQDAQKLLGLYYKLKEIEVLGKEQNNGGFFPFINFNVRQPDGQTITGQVIETLPHDELQNELQDDDTA